ncbi:MAG: glycosyltransferase involved in cell wall biosynthesis [Patiriisocius sp.]|jgi:glycosyltransferase involved in cell wall biosynthesis
MNIAFLTPEYPHTSFGPSGGMGSSLVHLAQGLVGLGHTVTILIYGQNKDQVFTENGITFYVIKNIKVKGLSRYLTQRKVERRIDALYDAGKIAIVEAPDWTGFTSRIKTACPLVLRLHGSDTYFCHLDNRKVKRRNKYHEQRAFISADGIISVSAFTGKLSNQLFDSERNITVIPNGLDLDLFAPSMVKNDAKTILYFGTLIRKKGMLELPLIFNKIIALVPDATLVLIGSDSSDIKTGSASTWSLMQPLFSESAAARVSYLGKVAYDDMKAHIEKASVCIFPTFAEALPVSWIEAMAMKKAIVASNVGWAKEMIADGKNGFLVHPTNHDSFANSVVKLLLDSEKNSAFGAAAREAAELKYDRSKVAISSVDFYQKIIKESVQ